MKTETTAENCLFARLMGKFAMGTATAEELKAQQARERREFRQMLKSLQGSK